MVCSNPNNRTTANNGNSNSNSDNDNNGTPTSGRRDLPRMPPLPLLLSYNNNRMRNGIDRNDHEDPQDQQQQNSLLNVVVLPQFRYGGSSSLPSSSRLLNNRRRTTTNHHRHRLEAPSSYSSSTEYALAILSEVERILES